MAANTGHILLVEDNIVALHLIESMVKQAGLRYTSSIDGERALELAKSKEFDFIITDIGLPGMSGYDLAYSIRQWEKDTDQKPVPIIGLTAHEPYQARKECLQSGMNDMLSKPINFKTIQELIQQFIR